MYLRTRPALLWLLLLLAVTLQRFAGADASPVFNADNGHYYEGVAVGGGGINWGDANAAAQGRTYLGMQGHLVTLTSAAEKSFVNSNFPTAVNWGWWLGAYQPPGSAEPAGGWTWVTGEPWSYTSWSAGEPNNNGNESALQYAGGGNGNWNDVTASFLFGGYIVEYEPAPGPPPDAPTNLTTTPISPTRIDLAWSHPAASSVSFLIERKIGSGSYSQVGIADKTTTYSDTGLVAGTTYTYRVRALAGGVPSAYSNESTATTPDATSPVQNPANGHFYQVVSVPAGIVWADADAAARGRSLQGAQGHLVTFTSAAENQFVASSFPDAVAGQFWLGGFQLPNSAEPAGGWVWTTGETWSYTNWNSGEPNNSGAGESSLEFSTSGAWNDDSPTAKRNGFVVEYEPGLAPPAPPSALTGNAVSPQQIDLRWTDGSTNENGFKIERKVGGGSYQLIALTAPDQTRFSDVNVVENSAYTYRVRACNGGGDSANSAELLITTPVDPINQITFAGPTNYSVPNETGVIEVADLDSDGYLDLIVCNGGISLLYGKGDGTFENAVSFSVGSNTPAQAIGVDINNDGRPDILVADNNSGKLWVLTNQGNRTFVAAGYSAGSVPFGVTVGDFNRDGWPDMAVSDIDGNRLAVLLNLGNGTFGAPTFYGGGDHPAKIVTADFNGDGKLDLAMSNYVSGDVVVYLGNGNGTFTGAGSFGVGSYPAQLVVADFNRDGKLDIATANTFSHNVSVVFGNGDGSFKPGTFYPGDTYPHVMHVADLDGDGWPDLVFPNNGTDHFSVLRNRGDGVFVGPRSFRSGGTNVRMLAVGDFDRDGRIDVVSGNATEHTVSIFLNRTPPAVPRAPSQLTVTGTTSSQVNLAWSDNSTNETGFRIERKTANGSFAPIAALPAGTVSYSDTGVTPGTSYTYRVVAYNDAGDSLPSNETTAGPPANPPAAPSGLTVTLTTFARVDLSWTAGDGTATSFEIERKTGSASYALLVALGAVNTSFSDTSVLPSTTYTYHVRATNGSGASGYSNEVQVTTPPPPPTAPTIVTATAKSATSIVLSWSGATGQDGYKIERKIGSGAFTPLTSAGGNDASYTDTGLSPNTAYTYRIYSYNGSGDSDSSPEASATTLPLSPTGLTAVAVSASRIDLQWTDPNTPTVSAKLERSTDGVHWDAPVTIGAGMTQYSDTGLQSNTLYRYRISASGSGGVTDPTDPVQALTYPAAPTGLVLQSVSSNQVTINWGDGSTNPSAFQIERSSDGGSTFPLLATTSVGATTYSDTTVTPGATYEYRVRAVNDAGASDAAGPVTANVPNSPVTPPGAPSNLAVTGVTKTSVSLSWTPPSGPITGYQLDRSSDGGATFQPIATPDPGATSATDSGLNPGTTYKYRLRARNDGGDGDYSSVVTAKTLASPPNAPVNLKAVESGAHEIDLSWADGGGGTEHFVLERAIGSGSFELLATLGASTLTYADQPVQPGTTYHYRVKATSVQGDSAYASVDATIPAGGKLKIKGNLSFGAVKRNQTKTLRLTLSNTGKGALAVTVGTLPPPFKVTDGNGSVTLASKKSLTVSVQFTPPAAQSYSAPLSIRNSDPAAPTSITASGKGK